MKTICSFLLGLFVAGLVVAFDDGVCGPSGISPSGPREAGYTIVEVDSKGLIRVRRGYTFKLLDTVSVSDTDGDPVAIIDVELPAGAFISNVCQGDDCSFADSVVIWKRPVQAEEPE